jgi:hypothetical protein
MDRKKPYERPQVSRVVIDLLQEMLQACGGTTTGKNTFPNPPCQGGPGS